MPNAFAFIFRLIKISNTKKNPLLISIEIIKYCLDYIRTVLQFGCNSCCSIIAIQFVFVCFLYFFFYLLGVLAIVIVSLRFFFFKYLVFSVDIETIYNAYTCNRDKFLRLISMEEVICQFFILNVSGLIWSDSNLWHDSWSRFHNSILEFKNKKTRHS